MEGPKVMTRIRKDAVIVAMHILLINAQLYGKEYFKCKKKNHFSKFCSSSDGTQKTGNPKYFLRKDVHEVQNSGSADFEYDTDSVEFKHIQFTRGVCESSQGSQNIMFDEISTLHHAVTDLHLETKLGFHPR